MIGGVENGPQECGRTCAWDVWGAGRDNCVGHTDENNAHRLTYVIV